MCRDKARTDVHLPAPSVQEYARRFDIRNHLLRGCVLRRDDFPDQLIRNPGGYGSGKAGSFQKDGCVIIYKDGSGKKFAADEVFPKNMIGELGTGKLNEFA